MIVCVVPMLSKAEINADSNYVFLCNALGAMLRQRRDLYVVMVWPDDKSGFKYDDDGFFKHRRICRVPMPMSTRKMSGVVSFDGRWWDRLLRTIGIDVIWTQVVETAHLMENMGTAAYMENARPAVVASHHYVIHKSLPYPLDSLRGVIHSQLLGGLGAARNVFNSQHCRWMFGDTAGEVFKSGVVADIMKRSTIIPLAAVTDDLQPVETNNEVPVIIYNHRFQSYKNYETTFELFDELHGTGEKFRVIVTAGTPENLSRVADRPYVEIRMCPKREDYHAALRLGDLNVTNSQHETFCISAVESMACGQVLVAPNGVTFPEITNAVQSEYPFLFNDIEQQKALLRRLLNAPAERKHWGRILSDHVRRNYTSDRVAESYLALFDEMTQFDFTTTAPDAKDMLVKVLRESSGNTTAAISTRVLGETVNGRHPFAGQSMPNTRLIRILRWLGASVVMEGGVQRVYFKG